MVKRVRLGRTTEQRGGLMAGIDGRNTQLNQREKSVPENQGIPHSSAHQVAAFYEHAEMGKGYRRPGEWLGAAGLKR